MSYTNGLDKPTDYFNTVLYVGNETDNHAITGVGFQPDFVWAKNRTVAESHNLFDSVRGATKLLIPNTTNAESTQATFLKSFDTDGFTLGTSNNINDSGANLVAWNFLASNTTSSNTDGSITSTVSTNTTSGFSIVSYTGTDVAGDTVGHGLGAVPKWILVKRLVGSGYDWVVYHANDTAGLYLNSTGVNNDSSANSIWFNGTAPTSSVFSIGTDGRIGDATSYIAYCFAEKKGFSKFGSYTGNGSSDGTFVYTGFKPAMLIMKASSGISNWTILDNKRDPHNVTTNRLQPNLSNAEDTPVPVDFLSNGFKHRSTNLNSSGDTFVYMSFATEPFTTSTGIPCTAR